jgi:predicted ATP-grasp superfamily ATP-dependent carboligase
LTDRVVVTDVEERAALAACRGLASAGYRVCAVARHRPAAGHWSRMCAERVVAPDPRKNVEAFVDTVAEALRRDRCSLLVPGSDASLVAVSERRDRLGRSAVLGLPSREAVRRSGDKLLLLEVAAEAGLAPPPSRICRDANDAPGAGGELGYPVVLKPARSFVPVNGGLRQQGVVLAAREPVLREAARRLTAPFIVQRFERAGFLSCTGLVAEGRLLALTTSRVLRLWPPAAGMHTYSETVPAPPGLAGKVRDLLKAVGWQGIFQLQMLEFDGGRLSVIDLNARPFASLALDVYAGANLPAIWCDWLLGRNPSPVVARPGMRYRWEEGELCHFAWQLGHFRLRAAAAVLKPHRRVTHAWFRVTDPAPLLVRAFEVTVRRCTSVLVHFFAACTRRVLRTAQRLVHGAAVDAEAASR